jgi:hypothetical protein
MAIIQSLAGVPSPAAYSHFTGAATSTVNATQQIVDGGWGLAGVNEGSTSLLTDEPNGVLQVTNDTGDNDNHVLFAGKWQPQHGNMVMEARLKVDNVSDLAIWVGFTETLALATPVMPSEYATATMTYNGTGGMVGLMFDADGTTDIWRSAFGDGGAITSGATAGGVSGKRAAVADVYDIVTVQVDGHGKGSVFLNSDLVEEVEGAITVTDNLFGIVMVENRAADAAVWEVDYGLARGGADYADGA